MVAKMSKFLCWIPEYGHTVEDAREVQAFDAELAVSEYVRRYEAEDCDYPVGGGIRTIEVMCAANGEDAVAYIVSGDARPTYSASKKRIRAAAEVGTRLGEGEKK